MTLNPRSRSLDELKQTVSASRLGCFHGCRLRFYFRYVLGLVSPQSPARHLGTSVHHGLKLWNLARWRKQSLPPETLREHYETFFTQEQPAEIRWETGEENETKAQGWSLLDLYFQQTPIPANERPEGVEVSVEADLSSHGLPKLIGILDLVRAGGRIVDFKTAGQTPTPDKAIHLHELQLTCYGELYREATGRKEGGFELHHLIKTKQPKLVVTSAPPMTEGQRAKLFRLLESYVDGLDRQDWVPSPNPMSCASCEFLGHCRNWKP